MRAALAPSLYNGAPFREKGFMMEYYRLSEGLNNYKLVPISEDVWSHIKTNNKDYYRSLYIYNDEHYTQWKKTGSVSGIKNTKTNRLFFDFDSGENVTAAKEDAATLVTRLIKDGVSPDNIQIAFSGSKGFSVEIETTEQFSPEEFKNITFALAKDLKTFDRVVNDANRIIRIVGTKHPKSGLYKIPLTINQLTELPVDIIKGLASSDEVDADVMTGWVPIKLPTGLVKLKETVKVEKKKSEAISHDLDMSLKPKWLSEVRFAIQEGYFPSGQGKRNHAFMILASTYRKQGFNKEVVYRMLKGVAEVQAQRNNSERYPDDELWNNVIQVVFSEHWKGGIYKDSEDSFLIETAERLGLKITKEEEHTVTASSVSDIFKRFAMNIEKNTMKLGIQTIDENITVTTSMLVGLLAAPSAGKTSLSLNILNSNSKRNINSIFFSLDMGAPLVFQRLIQKHTGHTSKKIFQMYKENNPEVDKFNNIISKEYSNVKFCFRSGITVEGMRQIITEENEKLDPQNKVKLVVIDYLECIQGPFSDATANTGLISQQLKDLANELECTVLLLLQPQKQAGDPSDELLSYRKIKGSSAIEQAASIVLTMWRPGFSAQRPEDDRYMTVAAVKNRMGQLGAFDFGWEGLKGTITELDDYEREELDELRKRKQLEKLAQKDDL